ncbi:hypothetical protein FY528_12365 [Hymenobacter lutimineralis]|uniref:Uncharacterized protein n=1 Tax=Hymenobacter lutimineralis TaxID=2606448 RepID=A0A5D6V0A1_9BACT|nr:hypothetical protein [Hymenobacter lutimineralis]TYZ08665.1 hypothetical protein FY528_12365 [Hymenobacter lutimineralis]
MTHKTKWLTFAPAGLMVIGLGTCLVQWASNLKEQQAPTATWVGAGTLALGVLNAGVSLFGRGVAESVLYQLREKASDLPTAETKS